MNGTPFAQGRHLARLTAGMLAVLGVGLVLGTGTARATEKTPIRIGVIAPMSAAEGKGIVRGAKLAAAEINAHNGIDGRPIKLYTYDDQLSASTAVRDFQRLVQQDKVVAVVGTWLSEVALAVEPWASRLKTPYLISDAGSPQLTRRVHEHYGRYKYSFSMLSNSVTMAHTVCDFVHHTLAAKMGAQRAAILSENAKWTQAFDQTFEKCLPKAGTKVVDHLRFDPGTSDFTPVFEKVEKHHPGVLVTGLAHTGLEATVQWHQRQVPSLMVGMNALAQSHGFWKQSNGAAQDVVTLSGPVRGVDLTPKTAPYMDAFIQRFGDKVAPGFGVTTYDAIHILRNAIERAGSTNADKLVAALEKTDYVGAGNAGHIRFYGRSAPYTHNSTYRMIMIQWQGGKRVPVWPPSIAKPVKLPGFVQLGR